MSHARFQAYNVAGALLVKLFGRGDDEVQTFSTRARDGRDAGIRQAMYGRVFFVALGLVGALGAAAIYGLGAHLVVRGTITAGTLVATGTFERDGEQVVVAGVEDNVVLRVEQA